MQQWPLIKQDASRPPAQRLTHEEWHSGDRVWLIELISPFSTPQNKLSEPMLRDLMNGPFRTTAFNLHRTDPATGRRVRMQIAHHLRADVRTSG